MNIFITLVLPITAIIVIAYGTDLIYLLHWAIQSGLEDHFQISSGKDQKVPPIGINRKTTDTENHQSEQNNRINRFLSDLSSSDMEKRLQAEELIKQLPPDTIEKNLLKLILDKDSDPETANSAAGILLERGGEEIVPLLAQFFSQKDKGIAGFLDERDYNKVVNLFE